MNFNEKKYFLNLAIYCLAICFIVQMFKFVQAEQNVTDNRIQQVELVNQSLNDLINELNAIKREATKRLANVRSQGLGNEEKIRQAKVSRFVLTKVKELEQESTIFKQELEQIFNVGGGNGVSRVGSGNPKQLVTMLAPTDELIESGEQLIARLEQQMSRDESAGSSGNSIRGVHDESVQLIDRLVQNYLFNLRRAINRITRYIDHRAQPLLTREEQLRRQQQQQTGSSSQLTEAEPRNLFKRQAVNGQQPNDAQIVVQDQFVSGVANVRQSILHRIQLLSRRMHEFTMQWTKMLGRQQSPLIDRIPPRGVELWRDFWDTVRKQVRRINQEFRQIQLDMTRLITGGSYADGRAQYSPIGIGADEQNNNNNNQFDNMKNTGHYQDYYNNLSSEQQQKGFNSKLSDNDVSKNDINFENDNDLDNDNNNYNNDDDQQQQFNRINVIDENDDEFTRAELTRNPQLRQQIQQEIGVFGSIFDMMRSFIRRLRESASAMIRDVIDPNAIPNNNNDNVTPGPDIKPQIDNLLEETINSQRHINSQAKPVMLPKERVVG